MKGLIVGLLDGELTPEESRQVNEHLTRCAVCREDHEQLRQTTGKLAAISYVEPTDAVLARLWKTPYSRLTWNAALFMIIGGYAVVFGYAIFQFLTSGKEELGVKTAVAAVVIGFLMLLVRLIRERICTYKIDPYKDIER